MRTNMIAAAAALLLPAAANAQEPFRLMPHGYEEVVPAESSAYWIPPPVQARAQEPVTVTPVSRRLNLRLDAPPQAAQIPNGQQLFTRGVACSSEFQIRQISQGIAAAATTPNRTRRAAERSRQVAIDHQVDMGVCARFENRGYVVVGTGVFDRNDGASIPYVEAERTPDDTVRVTDLDQSGRVYLIYTAQ